MIFFDIKYCQNIISKYLFNLMIKQLTNALTKGILWVKELLCTVLDFFFFSILIFQPEGAPDGQPSVDLSSKRFSVGNVSQPCITKLYRCLASYATKDTKNRSFSVTVDDTLEVLIKDPAGISCPVPKQ